MATGRLQFPGHPRSHSYEYSSNAAFVGNEALPVLYEGYVFTPSEPRDDDLSSQDRWTRARITRSPATDENLQAEFDLQRHSKRTAQQDFCSISTTKRDQIMRLIEGMEKSNPGFTYQLVALKLEPDHAHEKNSTRKHDHKHRDSKKRRKATSLIQVVLQRKPGQRPNVISSAASTSSVQGVAGSTGSIDRAGRPRGKLVPRTLSGSHINTSMPQYLPPYLRHDLKWSNETSSRRATPAAQTQASQNEPPRPVPVSYRSASNTSQDFCPTLSSSSSSLDAAESSPPRKFSTTSCIVSNLPNQRSGRSNGQPLGTDLTPMSPWPTVSTPKGHLYTQVTPNQATYQQSISAQPQSEYPFPSVPQRLYVSCSTQTDVSWFSRSQDSRRASGYNFSDHEAPPRAHRYDEDDHAGKSEPKDVQSSESGITTVEDSDDGCDQSKLSQSKGPPISKADEKPSWMNNLVPVTPPAIAEGLLGLPRRRSNPMSPIVEDAVDDSDSHSGAPNAPINDQVDRSEHGDRPLAGERSDTKLSERIEINTSAPGYTCDSNGGRNRDLAGPTRKQSPDHGKPRPEKDNTTDTRIPSSLRKSSSYEKSNPGSRRDSGSSSAEPEYFALRPNDYADEKPWSPNKRVTFSLPPSPSHGSGSRSTSPAETPPSSSNSSPIVILSASTHPRAPGTRPPPPSQRSSYNPPPANPVIIDGTACRPPLNRQSQSSSSYRPKDRPSPQIKDGDPVHLASAPASFADLERHERPERDRVERQPSSHHTNLGNGNVIKRVAREHGCPYSSCGGPAFGFPRQ